jgi:hypothetical protein
MEDELDVPIDNDYRAAYRTILDASAGMSVPPTKLCSAFSTALYPMMQAVQKGSDGLFEDDDVTIKTLAHMVRRTTNVAKTISNVKHRKEGHENHGKRWTPEEREELKEAVRKHGVPVQFPKRSPAAIKQELHKILTTKYSTNIEDIRADFLNLEEVDIWKCLLPNHGNGGRTSLE